MTDKWTAIWQDVLKANMPHVLEARPSFRSDNPTQGNEAATVPAGLDRPPARRKSHHLTHQNKATLQQSLPRVLEHKLLLQGVKNGDPDAIECAFELMHLGEGPSTAISRFSPLSYLEWNTDVRKSRFNPATHFLLRGFRENRIWESPDIGHIRPRLPGKPFALVAFRDLSRSGAPIIGVELARQLASTYNVVACAPKPGPMAQELSSFCSGMIIGAFGSVHLERLTTGFDAPLAFALANSVQKEAFFHAIAKSGVPVATYIHEFPSYMDWGEVNAVVRYSDFVGYVSPKLRDVWAPIFKDYLCDPQQVTSVIPQAVLAEGHVTQHRFDTARKRLSDIIGLDLTGKKIVYGSGYIQHRKGIEYFLSVAAQSLSKDPDTVFLWIGDGFSRQNAPGHTVYIAEGMDALSRRFPRQFRVLPTGDYYHDVCCAADAFLCLSVLDPLPNVVFEALSHGTPVCLFEGATGFDQPDYRNVSLLTRVPFADTGAVSAFVNDLSAKLPRAEKETPPKAFLHNPRALREIMEGMTRVLGNAKDPQQTLTRFKLAHENAETLYLSARNKGRHLVWHSPAEVGQRIDQSDNWLHRSLSCHKWQTCDTPESAAEISIHYHVHYAGQVEATLREFAFFRFAKRLIITTTSENLRHRIATAVEASGIETPASIHVLENRGRDVVPMFRMVQLAGSDPDETWLHIHEKGSAHIDSDAAKVWKAFCLTILLGKKHAVSNAAQEALKDGIGIVAPLDPYIVGWTQNHRLLETVADAFSQPFPSHPLLLPVGNMFFAKTSVIKKMASLFHENYPWPNEPLPIDGSELHLVERLWPAVAADMGMKSVFIHRLAQKR